MNDDLISRISLKQSIVTSLILGGYKTLDQIIDEEPSIDAVQVVRCKDCKYYKENTLVCSRYGLEDDDYCSWAERREK